MEQNSLNTSGTAAGVTPKVTDQQWYALRQIAASWLAFCLSCVRQEERHMAEALQHPHMMLAQVSVHQSGRRYAFRYVGGKPTGYAELVGSGSTATWTPGRPDEKSDPVVSRPLEWIPGEVSPNEWRLRSHFGLALAEQLLRDIDRRKPELEAWLRGPGALRSGKSKGFYDLAQEVYGILSGAQHDGSYEEFPYVPDCGAITCAVRTLIDQLHGLPAVDYCY